MSSFRHYDDFEDHYFKAIAVLSVLGNQSSSNEVNAHAINTVVQLLNEHVEAMAESMDAFVKEVGSIHSKTVCH